MARIVTIPALPKGYNYLQAEGEFLAKVKEVNYVKGDPDYYQWIFEVVAGPYAGQTIQHRNWLRTEALWALRRTLEALGVKLPDSAFRIDLDKLIGRRLVIVVALRKASNGKEYYNVINVKKASEWQGAEEPVASTSDSFMDSEQFIDGDDLDDDLDDEDDEVPDVLEGPKA